jgi:hypothetical protein
VLPALAAAFDLSKPGSREEAARLLKAALTALQRAPKTDPQAAVIIPTVAVQIQHRLDTLSQAKNQRIQASAGRAASCGEGSRHWNGLLQTYGSRRFPTSVPICRTRSTRCRSRHADAHLSGATSLGRTEASFSRALRQRRLIVLLSTPRISAASPCGNS